MERRGALGDRSCRGSAAGAELEVLLRQQRAVRQCRQLSRARLCAVLRGGGYRPRRDMGRRHHAGQQLADGAVSAGFRAVPVGRGGRPGVRRMVQDPCPRRVLHRAQSGDDRRVRRCGHSGAGAGRKHPPRHRAAFARIGKDPACAVQRILLHMGQAHRGNRPAPYPCAERQKFGLLCH